MFYFNGNNKTLFHSTLVFVILLMTCASPLMLQAAGGSDDDFTSQKSRDYQRAVSYVKKSDYSAAIPLLRKELEKIQETRMLIIIWATCCAKGMI